MASRRTPDSPRPGESAPLSGAERRTKPRKPPILTRVAVTPEVRRAMVAENAYLRAERRGFEPGHEEEDWFAAEAEVDALLRVEHGGSPQ